MWRRLLPSLAILLVLALIVSLAWYFIRAMLDKPITKPRQQVQKITLLRPPPPPPPPPKMEQPPQPQEPIDTPEPEPEPETPEPESQADEPPPGEDLGLDADGSGAGDAFGLVGKKGGRGLIGGHGGSRFGWYAGLLKQDIESLLSDDDGIRKNRYSVILKIWLTPGGRIDRVKVVGSSGDPGLDMALEQALTRGGALSEAPPQDLPQPIRLRITSRG